MNKVILNGNLTADSEGISVGSQNKSLTKFRIAVNGMDKANPTFVNIETWEKTADNCAKYLSKGSPVLVEGRLAISSWEDDDGKKKSRMFVVGNSVEFLGKLKDDASPASPKADVSSSQDDDEVPF